MRTKYITHIIRIFAWLIIGLLVTFAKLHFETRARAGAGWGVIVAEPLLIMHVVISLVATIEARLLLVRYGSVSHTIRLMGNIGFWAIALGILTGIIYALNVSQVAKITMTIAWFVAIIIYCIMLFVRPKTSPAPSDDSSKSL
jgi:hypothetical protein